jgi:hypothetical protein
MEALITIGEWIILIVFIFMCFGADDKTLNQ